MKLNDIQIIKTRNSFDSITIALFLVVVVIGLAVDVDVDAGFEVVLAVVGVDVDSEIVLVVVGEGVDFEVVLVVPGGDVVVGLAIIRVIQSAKGSIRVNRTSVTHSALSVATPTS